jgi:ABC-type transport system involved in cytochrome c biogenesis permease subunit
VLGVILERIYRVGLGASAGSFIGFLTLIVAHHLSKGGDTMEMMRAVLDSNFWLGTHVVTITIGYSANFLAGFLGILLLVLGVVSRVMTRGMAAVLERLIYGIICFATLFSFVGTILGGIWADQSWGRFWGWDPKENGALIIVLWNAVILHARWAGMVQERGMACLAIFGNIVTSFSWFGVNMLGVGLHSYGFMDSAFKYLVIFTASQVALMLLAAVPISRWPGLRMGAAGKAGEAARAGVG